MHSSSPTRGFTLIEFSIVLVIIGIIVGGVLVGKDLVRAAEVSATITQVAKYSAAVDGFRSKYKALPGDMNAATAADFGFAARGKFAGEGDGNGVIEGIGAHAAGSNNGFLQSGETTLFWVDLSTAGLIDGGFASATPVTAPAIAAETLGSYFPAAKLGHGNYIYVYSTHGINYYGISRLLSVASGGQATSGASMTVSQAYQIDRKVDDGAPLTGNVTATYDTGALAENGAPAAASHLGNPPAATDCYDASATPAYAFAVHNGVGMNCVLSFRF